MTTQRRENLGLYVHIPFCESKCSYCDFYSQKRTDYDHEALIAALKAEILLHKNLNNITTAYIGGGSPSSIAPRMLLNLVECINKLYLNSAEFTIEVNPGQAKKENLVELHNNGVNRISIGAQSFNDPELKFLGRIHDVKAIYSAFSAAKDAGFENISIDLIFAIPGSSLENWDKTLNAAISLNPCHVSAYSLTFEEGTVFYDKMISGEIVPTDDETDRKMYELAIDKLSQSGFVQYEISNFAKPGFECQHNLNYWANGGYVGIGPSAASYLNGTRTKNVSDIDKYIEIVKNGKLPVEESETLSEVERACETAVLNLRRIGGINLSQFKQQTGFDALKLFAGPIEKFVKMGILKKNDERIFLSHDALAVADSVLCEFSQI